MTIKRVMATALLSAAVALGGLQLTSYAAPAGLRLIGPDVDPSRPMADKLTIGYVSDFGGCGYGDPKKCEDETAVAAMVKSWNPDYILTSGDNSQQQATEEQVALSAAPYEDALARPNFFYPIFGNHDYGNSCDEAGAKYSIEYWKVPTSYRAELGNGLVEWLNPDGACQTSNGETMPPIFDDYMTSLNSSQAVWKFTGIHQPPYSSGKSGNNINRRWAIQPGVDLMLSGHDHDSEFVIDPDGHALVVNGIGGDGTTDLFTPTTGSQFRQNESLGAGRITVTKESVRFEFVALGGQTMYEFTLRKDSDGKTYVADKSDWTDPRESTRDETTIPAKPSVHFDAATDTYDGLNPVSYPDGPWEKKQVAGREAVQLTNKDSGANYMYLQVDDEAMSGGPFDLEAEVSYYADKPGNFSLQFESSSTGSAYETSAKVSVDSTKVGSWQTATIPLKGINLNNRQNGNSDLRLQTSKGLALAVSAVTIRNVAKQPVVEVKYVPGEAPDGLSPVTYSSGPFSVIDAGGAKALRVDDSTKSTGNNLYLQVDDSRLAGGPTDAWLSITYRADKAGKFTVQYDSAETGLAYTKTEPVAVDAGSAWQRAVVALPAAMFQNRQNGDADLRIISAKGFNYLVKDLEITTYDPANPPSDNNNPTNGGSDGDNPGGEPTTPSATQDVSWTPSNPDGITFLPYESGPFHMVDEGGEKYLQIDKNTINSGNNLYVDVDDLKLSGGPHDVWFTLEYRSPVAGQLVLQYEDQLTGEAYHNAPTITIPDSQVDAWQRVSIELPAAMFNNRQNANADFRLRGAKNLPFQVRAMSVTSTKPSADESPTPSVTPSPSSTPTPSVTPSPSSSPSPSVTPTPSVTPSPSPSSTPSPSSSTTARPDGRVPLALPNTGW